MPNIIEPTQNCRWTSFTCSSQLTSVWSNQSSAGNPRSELISWSVNSILGRTAALSILRTQACQDRRHDRLAMNGRRSTIGQILNLAQGIEAALSMFNRQLQIYRAFPQCQVISDRAALLISLELVGRHDSKRNGLFVSSIDFF